MTSNTDADVALLGKTLDHLIQAMEDLSTVVARRADHGEMEVRIVRADLEHARELRRQIGTQ